MRVVDVELDTLEQVPYLFGGLNLSIDVAFDLAVLDGPCYLKLVKVLIAIRSLVFVAVVEHESDGGFGHSRVAALVDQILDLVCPYS